MKQFSLLELTLIPEYCQDGLKLCGTKFLPTLTNFLFHWIKDKDKNCQLKRYWTRMTSSPNFKKKKASRKSSDFIPLEVLAWVLTAYQVLCSRVSYCWRNVNITSIFCFSKSTSINEQYRSLCGTLWRWCCS